MAVFNYKSGMHSVGQYQMSSVPYLSSSIIVPKIGESPLEITFPMISKFITVRNTLPTASNPVAIRVGFSSQGVSGTVAALQNYVVLANGESYTGEWRVKNMYLLCDTGIYEASASVVAGLTVISTGSVNFDNWSGSIGV